MDYRFGPFRYDAQQRLLYRNEELIPLQSKAVETLHVLIERRGTIVGKEELMKLVWPDTTVEEIGLARNISLLRKVLDDDPGGKGYIETLPRRGYRFAAETPDVVAAAQKSPSRRTVWWLITLAAVAALIYWQFYMPSRYLRAAHASIVIIPFERLGSNVAAGQPDSLAGLIVAEVSKNQGLHVISPAVVRRYQRIGFPANLMARILLAQVILDGTVERIGEQVRATGRLADVHSGKLIWSEVFEYSTPQEQERTAAAIARQVAGKLSVK